VKRHATLPDGKDFGGMREVMSRLVKQHITQTPAQHDTKHAIQKQIIKAAGLDGRAPRVLPAEAHAPQHQNPGKCDQVHQAIPVHRQWPQGEDHRIELGMKERGCSHAAQYTFCHLRSTVHGPQRFTEKPSGRNATAHE
jgi:hypothetical protein